MEDTLLMYEFKLIDVKTKQWISMALLKELFLTFEVAKSQHAWTFRRIG